MMIDRSWVMVAAVVMLVGCDAPTTDPERRADDDAEFRTFISPPDMGGGDEGPECWLGLQNCPAGEKCNPYATSGWFKDYRCVPLHESPKAPGEPCEIEGILTSGLDDCQRGSFCWSDDGESLQGTCLSHQVGTRDRPLCTDPLDIPAVGESVLTPCVPGCNPLAPVCADDEGCYRYRQTDRFVCEPIATVSPVPPLGECSVANECTPGASCLGAGELPWCTGLGCCVPYCSTSAPDCPDGTACEPWYEDDAAPPGFFDLGACR